MSCISRSCADPCRYTLFVSDCPSEDDAGARNLLESLIAKHFPGIKLVIKTMPSKKFPTPELHAGFDTFAGLQDITDFVLQEAVFA